ncbi:cold-shock protein [Paenibacillus alkalitolerans]|uniref:cold-shock protein n=1 Tax=Paenibacillus alkalitolerans TaxID=2799335 RepID=UPI0018F71589|nr:cold-shock protein [Paenibacillus alkalitolerans]
MYYSRKRALEDIPNEMTSIWSCTKEDCNGWMRDDFSFEAMPCCPQCKSPMINSVKSLPILINSNQDLKHLKKTVPVNE